MNEQLTAVVMETDPELRELLTALLEGSGYRVHASSTAREGIQLARKHQPDLVTTELHLPGMDGLEATRQIRAFSDTYILIISTSHDQLDVCLVLEAGADAYIAKPFSPRILQARVDALQRRPRNKFPAARPTQGNVLHHGGVAQHIPAS
ncbi:response regulator transcription factor [Arthrobacter sp.]|uniref:response regulator transcription factor n=1 Tax=Arthrobacter sp. TaxID=1667 RepID=UPI0026DFFF5E|nr:response regulator transcription factor [Arthrobacter sp.]MDO5753424.1 response regulator transcription factor [Arthrobacter sp.]